MTGATRQIIEKKLKGITLPDVNDINNINNYVLNIYTHEIRRLEIRTEEDKKALKEAAGKIILKHSLAVNAEIYRKYGNTRRKTTARLNREINNLGNWVAFYKNIDAICAERINENPEEIAQEERNIQDLITCMAVLPVSSAIVSLRAGRTNKTYIIGNERTIVDLYAEMINRCDHSGKKSAAASKAVFEQINNKNKRKASTPVIISEKSAIKKINKILGMEYSSEKMRKALAEETEKNKELENIYAEIIRGFLQEIDKEIRSMAGGKPPRCVYAVMLNKTFITLEGCSFKDPEILIDIAEALTGDRVREKTDMDLTEGELFTIVEAKNLLRMKKAQKNMSQNI